MGTILASDLLTRAADILQDITKVRWPEDELLRYMNDAQRQIVLQIPGANASNTTMAVVAGTKQTIPSDGVCLLDVVRNVGGRAIRLIDRDILDTQRPLWHTEAAGAEGIKHYIFDPRDPTHFYVYPPPAAGSIEIIYSSAPTDIATTATAITLPDIYANAILDYMLYRAYSKDAEYAGNSSRAAAAYAAFLQSLGQKTETESKAEPNVNAPPRGRFFNTGERSK